MVVDSEEQSLFLLSELTEVDANVSSHIVPLVWSERSTRPVRSTWKLLDVMKCTGVHMKAVFWLGIMFFMQISCLRFKQSRISLLISHIYVLGCFGNFLVIFRYIWREIVFLKGLVKLMEIGNFEDLLLF